MNKFVLKQNNFLKFNYFLQSQRALAVQTPAIKNDEKTTIKTLEAVEKSKVDAVYKQLNEICKDPRQSRLFAVVMIAGSQFKVTTEDVIIVRNSFYPTIGDRIRLEKVLLVGSKDFTVVGKPLLSKKFVQIDATVIEKTLTNDVIRFTYKPRRDNRKMAFIKEQLTMLRINNIDLIGNLP